MVKRGVERGLQKGRKGRKEVENREKDIVPLVSLDLKTWKIVEFAFLDLKNMEIVY